MNAAAIYDKYWQSGHYYNPEWGEKEFRRILGPLIELDHVLDYGCGLGYAYQRQLSSVVKGYAGADVSDYALSAARQKGLRALKIDPETGSIRQSRGRVRRRGLHRGS